MDGWMGNGWMGNGKWESEREWEWDVMDSTGNSNNGNDRSTGVNNI